jgi:hypothetical protein
MPRRPGEDVDWYVEMSEWLERRERRRKWIVLGVCVAVPLLLMGITVSAIVLKDRLPEALHGIFKRRSTPVVHTGYEGPREIQVENFVAGVDIRFAQLDPNSGLVTTATHVFRELLPENSRIFIVDVEDDTHGKVRLYRLRNLGTGETFDFPDVPVRKIGTAGWVIEQDVGWKVIHDQLQAKTKIQLAMPVIGR